MRHNVIKLQLISLFGKALCSLRCLIHFLYLAQYIVLVIGFRTLQTMCLFILSNHFIWSLHTSKFFIKDFSKYKLFLRLNIELKTTLIIRGGSRTAATSRMERFVIIVNCYYKALHLGCSSNPRSASDNSLCRRNYDAGVVRAKSSLLVLLPNLKF